MSRFVRPSKYRHVYGTAARRELSYDNVKVSGNAWDTNLIKVNPKFFSLNWNSSGGGAFAVIPLSMTGKISDALPLYRGHSAAVLDTDFSPFNDNLIASGAEDSKVFLYTIPDEIGEVDIEPVVRLNSHGRKVGQVLFNPVAENVLLSASADLTMKLWDVEKGVEKQEITGHMEIIQSVTWNYNGTLVATTCRDKKLRVFDVRSNKVVQITDGHSGIKGSRVVWMGDSDRIATTGFSKMSDRQVYIWDTANLGTALKTNNLDTSSGVIMPFYDGDSNMLYLAGKGDGNIRYYEYENDEMFSLSEYGSNVPQRGVGFMPKRGLNVNDCEIARAYKVSNGIVEPISFTVPRKSDSFQADLFPDCVGDEAALTADAWFGGETANPKLVSLEKGFTASVKKEFVASVAAQAAEDIVTPLKSDKDYQEAYHKLRQENEDLKNQIAQKDVKIRLLEVQLEQLSSA
ncbi:Coronin-like protein crn1 [Mortierella sp. GBA35]|nr:Coronin-like protein crn1 [Mortierella sp. AD031]KAF9104761.1 Coronin-like protein crn1 [Mortierella sp. GBA35]KAG0213616.1 Coronin-like protein crn1 [Mortierella sp. NVP41]